MLNMSRQIKFNLEGVLLQAPISKVDRAKLYGRQLVKFMMKMVMSVHYQTFIKVQ